MSESNFESQPVSVAESLQDASDERERLIDHIMDTRGVSRAEAEAQYTGEYPLPPEKDTDDLRPLPLNEFNRYGYQPKTQTEWREMNRKGFLMLVELLDEIDESKLASINDTKELARERHQLLATRRARNDRRREAGLPVID